MGAEDNAVAPLGADGDPIDCSPDSSDLAFTKNGSAVSVSIDRDFIVPVILSCGIAAAMVAFVFLAYLYPSQANWLIPAMAAPAGAAIVNLIRCKNCKQKK